MPSPIVRRAVRMLAVIGISVLTLMVAIVALLQVPAVATWVTGRLLALVPLNPGYALEVGRVSGNWFTGLQLGAGAAAPGLPGAGADRAASGSRYDPRQLRGPDRRLRELVVDGGRVAARRERDGWDIANAFRTSADTSSAGGDFLIDRLTVRRVDVAAQLAPGLDRHGSAASRSTAATSWWAIPSSSPWTPSAPRWRRPASPPLWFDLAAAGAATAEEIRLDPLRIKSHRSDIAGRLVLPRSFDDPRIAERLDVELEALPLALADLASVYPGVPPEGDVRLEATASAAGRLVTARLAARLDQGTDRAGRLDGRGTRARRRCTGFTARCATSIPPGSTARRRSAW